MGYTIQLYKYNDHKDDITDSNLKTDCLLEKCEF